MEPSFVTKYWNDASVESANIPTTNLNYTYLTLHSTPSFSLLPLLTEFVVPGVEKVSFKFRWLEICFYPRSLTHIVCSSFHPPVVTLGILLLASLPYLRMKQKLGRSFTSIGKMEAHF